MNDETHCHPEEEHPRNHFYQIMVLLVFLAVWIPDSFLLHISTFLRKVIPLGLNLGAAIITSIGGVFLIHRSHDIIFKSQRRGLVSTGIFGRVRHPMYLGVILMYAAAVIGTLSALSIVPLLIAILVYDRMADYEEKKLEEMLGDKYSEYKQKVPKWIPR